MPRQLSITPTPFKSSFLSIPPSPFSPRLPITPAVTLVQATTKPPTNAIRAANLRAGTDLVPPPPEPLRWLWQCHKCNRVYPLGVTRRCLDDGHTFCPGMTVVKRSKRNENKRTVRHAACASEFDYQGWKGWGVWRRGVVERVEAAEALMREGQDDGDSSEEEEKSWFGSAWIRKESKGDTHFWNKGEKPAKLKKDCWNRCDYPSECRWGKQFGVQTLVVPATVVPSTPAEQPEAEQPTPLPAPTTDKEKKPATTFDDILIDLSDPTSLDYLSPLSPSDSHAPEARRVTEGETKMTSPYDLVQSAKRRKRKSSGAMPLVPSPLALNPPSTEEEKAPEEVKTPEMLEMEMKEGRPKSRDDLDLDVLSSGKKGGLLGEMGVLQRRADDLVQSWRYARTKFRTGAL
ncbi:Hypothetical predicted protein [Lecanosticta acicola]|uniref:Uncharacterized protein n=1 Tax=Lecanosticta acicola TaxID=111012 RepID=A0AAI8Z695_9PEZI|nr:Hypothetical predicted protein [Lecanosticta acicola]